MKILMLNRGIFPVPSEGGAEFHSYMLTNAIAELGHEVHYVTDVTKNAKFHKNVIVHKPNKPSLQWKTSFYSYVVNHFIGNTFAFKEASYLLIKERHNFDVIHCHGAFSSLLTSRIKNNVPLVLTVHDPTPYIYTYDDPFEWLLRRAHCRLIDLNAWRGTNHIITVSNFLKKELMRWGISSENITVIPSGVDTDTFRPNSSNTCYILDKYKIQTPYCLFVGILTSRKGVKYFLQALGDANIHCVIVGDGPERPYLMSLSKDIGISNRVTFTGFVTPEDLIGLYSSANFFVLPSVAEGLPLVLLEAMSCGLPVIGSKVGGIPDVIIDGYNGFLVEPRDVSKLHDLISLLAENPQLCKEMGKNARLIMKRRFNWRLMAEKTLKIYRMMMGNS